MSSEIKKNDIFKERVISKEKESTITEMRAEKITHKTSTKSIISNHYLDIEKNRLELSLNKKLEMLIKLDSNNTQYKELLRLYEKQEQQFKNQ